MRVSESGRVSGEEMLKEPCVEVHVGQRDDGSGGGGEEEDSEGDCADGRQGRTWVTGIFRGLRSLRFFLSELETDLPLVMSLVG